MISSELGSAGSSIGEAAGNALGYRLADESTIATILEGYGINPFDQDDPGNDRPDLAEALVKSSKQLQNVLMNSVFGMQWDAAEAGSGSGRTRPSP
jgi:hypothetical protein